jgi:hypothetical protein
MMIPSEHAPTLAPYVNEMIGELITPAQVLAKEMVIRSDCDDDEEANDKLASSNFEGNFSI